MGFRGFRYRSRVQDSGHGVGKGLSVVADLGVHAESVKLGPRS